ncbi:FadR/GntR family transcriptional regulator [Fodinicola feengrottensis]|uniref:FadR/GntR family transcriptional regulator n=1 Tax=Fodinicola feengrottensis TaxID=435914 RepID=UPI002441B8F9|nr:GntR family transcriptional regulator [Fodinicola feengrottensis]
MRVRTGPGAARRHRVGRAVEVQEAVKQIILDRRLGAGDPLPTEFELMESLGAGRNSVREALKALQAVGIVEIRHGFGMFVGEMTLSGLVDELTFHSRMTLPEGAAQLGHLMEIREVLEVGLVRRLIERHPDADLAPVTEVIDRMAAEALAGAVSAQTDRLFHEVLYRPLGNPLVGQLLGAFWDVYYQLRDHLGAPARRDAGRGRSAAPRHLSRGGRRRRTGRGGRDAGTFRQHPDPAGPVAATRVTRDFRCAAGPCRRSYVPAAPDAPGRHHPARTPARPLA